MDAISRIQELESLNEARDAQVSAMMATVAALADRVDHIVMGYAGIHGKTDDRLDALEKCVNGIGLNQFERIDKLEAAETENRFDAAGATEGGDAE